MSACRQCQNHCQKWMHRSSVLMYEGHFESNAFYFIMLSHIRGGSWWYDSRGWTFLPKGCQFCCRATDGSRAEVSQNGASHGSAYEAECVTEFLHAEQNAPNDIHWRNVYGNLTVDVSTVRRWVVRFRSGDLWWERQATFWAALELCNELHVRFKVVPGGAHTYQFEDHWARSKFG
jgi:hypothetical protein